MGRKRSFGQRAGGGFSLAEMLVVILAETMLVVMLEEAIQQLVDKEMKRLMSLMI